MRLAGETQQTKIARELGVDASTISRDFAVLDEQWRMVENPKTIGLIKATQNERIEALIAALWPEAIAGKLLTVDRVIALLDRQAKLLGLDAPTRINLVDTLRRRALDDGLDPEAIVRAAEELLHEAAV